MTRRRGVAGAVAILIAIVLWLRLGPLPPRLLDEDGVPSTVVLDRNGVVLYEARSSRGDRSTRMRPEAIPPVLLAATLAAEDHRFWAHPGIDPVSIARAGLRNLRAGRTVQGGSTITQQVAKLLLARRQGTRAQGWRAKAYEALVAFRLEHRLSKREILALYLTWAPYGNQIVGAERASRAYFDRDAAALTPAQAAFLAALPQRPSSFNPWRDAAKARGRQQAVLRRMHAIGLLNAAELRLALAERVAPVPGGAGVIAPHFVQRVLSMTGSARPERIETTLDANLQRSIAGIIAARREDLRAHGARHVAVVVLDNATAQWLAWEGSGDYFDPQGGAIDGVQAPRQPGSALKPFTYALAFERGYGPSSVLPDIPSSFPTADPGVFYAPVNYDGRYRGPLLARAALAGSENVPAVALLSRLGPASLLRLLRRAGIATLEKSAAFYGLGLTLGNAEIRLDELTAAYAALARGGVAVAPGFLRGERTPPASERLLSARAAYWVTDILADPDAREYVFGRGGSLEFPFPVAAKTGTSQAYRDNWAIGYTREVTVGVWVGNFDRTPLRNSSGVTGAGPIFHAVMLAAMERAGAAAATGPGATAFDIVPPTADVERRRVCLLSGMVANWWCPRRQWESVARDADARPCSWHHLADEGLLTIWPAEYRSWAASNVAATNFSQNWEEFVAATKPSGAQNRKPGAPAGGLSIVNPPPGAIYLLDPTLRPEYQTLPLRAAGASGDVTWHIDGRPVGRGAAERAIHWPLAAGRHTVAAEDARGRRAVTTVIVR